MAPKNKSKTEIEYPKFTRREIWLTYFKENVDYDHSKFAISKNESLPNEDGGHEQLLAMMTPTAVSVTVNTEKELIKIELKPQFILQNPKNSEKQQTAYEVGIGQTFKVKNFKELFFDQAKETYVIPKDFANELIYYTFIAAIGMIESLPKKKTISKFNLHYSDTWKNCMKEDILCSDEDFFTS
ncbi:MAG: hypothetical protein Q7J16_12495 [Candidatus Cloacimonadales bacterium]|nr:hypothetical protein [Candidatus Cloacimonadales bacterium]